LDKMYQITKDQKYSNYALFLYQDFSKTYQSEKDVQLANILNPQYKLQSHGVHTYEHLRPLIVAAYANQNTELNAALAIYIDRIKNTTTPTGGPIGDEWIAEKSADASHTGYEYCSIHELLDSYTVLLQKSGNASNGDEIETIFYNAAQGSRNPNHSCIAYLKTDNSFEMLGTKNGEIEADRKQTRYKYSAVHQDVAVCCSPNAGRISPYFIQSSWMKENDKTLVATLLMPNILTTEVNGNRIEIENKTNYPNENRFDFRIESQNPTTFKIKIRKPDWVNKIITTEKYTLQNDYIVIEREFKKSDRIQIEFKTKVQIKADANNNHYFRYGALIYANPIESRETVGKVYDDGFEDLNYQSINLTHYQFIDDNKAQFKNGFIKVNLKNKTNNNVEAVYLLPFCKTILRQAGF
jgi:uncharacterized protein